MSAALTRKERRALQRAGKKAGTLPPADVRDRIAGAVREASGGSAEPVEIAYVAAMTAQIITGRAYPVMAGVRRTPGGVEEAVWLQAERQGRTEIVDLTAPGGIVWGWADELNGVAYAQDAAALDRLRRDVLPGIGGRVIPYAKQAQRLAVLGSGGSGHR